MTSNIEDKTSNNNENEKGLKHSYDDKLISEELGQMYKYFFAAMDKIENARHQHEHQYSELEHEFPSEIGVSCSNLIHMITTHLEITIRISLGMGYSLRMIGDTIKLAKNQVSSTFQRAVDKARLKEQGNNKLADILANDLASLDVRDQHDTDEREQ